LENRIGWCNCLGGVFARESFGGYAQAKKSASKTADCPAYLNPSERRYDRPAAMKGPKPGIVITPMPTSQPRVPQITAPEPTPSAALSDAPWCPSKWLTLFDTHHRGLGTIALSYEEIQ